MNNRAEVTGMISSDFTFGHEVYGEGFYNFDIEVPRLSEAKDTLPVTISERLLDGTFPPVGTMAQITGQVRSYNNYVESDRRNKLVLTLFAREFDLGDTVGNRNPNNIYLNGFICKPPVYRATPFGREITDVLIAVNRSYNKSDYIPCIAWGRNARFAGKLSVGDNIEVWGRMQSRNYQKRYDDETVVEKTAYEISVSKIEFCRKPEERGDEN